MKITQALMSLLQMDIYNFVRVFVLFGIVYGNHQGQGGSIGFLGSPGLSIDPFGMHMPLAASSASSSASSSAGGASSVAFSSAGRSRSSARSSAGRHRSPIIAGIVPSVDRRTSTLRRLPTIRGQIRRVNPLRLVLLPPDRRTTRVNPSISNLVRRRLALQNPRRLRQPQLVSGQRQQGPMVPLSEVLSFLRLLATDRQAANSAQALFGPPRTPSLGPPGVSFLGELRNSQSSLPVIQNVQASPIINRLNGGFDLPTINPLPGSFASSSASSGTSFSSSSAGTGGRGMDANYLTIEGQSPSGDLILGGPGGTITIGAEILTGIFQGNGSLIHTEFEELEPEELGRRRNARRGLQVKARNGRPIHLTGKQTVVGGGPHSNAPIVIGSGAPVVLNSSGSGLKVAASSSISGELTVSSSASAGSGGQPGGQNGVSVTSGAEGKVIHLKGKDTIKIAGGKNGKIKIGSQTAGVQAPGNATFIVGG